MLAIQSTVAKALLPVARGDLRAFASSVLMHPALCCPLGKYMMLGKYMIITVEALTVLSWFNCVGQHSCKACRW